MLYNDLYRIDSMTKEDGSAKAVLSLNVSHPIFKGHFPGQPVLPGACMLQMVKEIMELVTGNSLQLLKAHHIKFISLVDPSTSDFLQMNLVHAVSDEGLLVTGTLLREAHVCLKFSGVFTIYQSA